MVARASKVASKRTSCGSGVAHTPSMKERPELKTVSDDQLLRGLFEVLRKTRHDEADLVAHIAEVDARKLYAREASPSMFAWCTERLHLSEAEAYVRIGAARASRRHPVLLAMLADGRLHLSGIERLAPHLTEENRDAVLKRAVHKTRRQIEELVAEVAPRPAAATQLRKLPARRVPEACGGAAPGSQLRPDGAEVLNGALPVNGVPPSTGELGLDGVERAALRPDGVSGADSQLRPDGVETVDTGAAAPSGAGELRPNGVVAPAMTAPRPNRAPEAVAPDRFRLQFDLDAQLREKLERLQALMRSSVPDGDLGKIIDVAVTNELERLEARRFAKTKKPRSRLAQTDTRAKSRYIPAAVRRAVEERDGGRCTYRDKHGRRCGKRHDLEFHHTRPFAVGGDHRPEGVVLMCRTHNQLLAEEDFGKGKVERSRRRGRSGSGAVEAVGEGMGQDGLRARWRSTG